MTFCKWPRFRRGDSTTRHRPGRSVFKHVLNTAIYKLIKSLLRHEKRILKTHKLWRNLTTRRWEAKWILLPARRQKLTRKIWQIRLVCLYIFSQDSDARRRPWPRNIAHIVTRRWRRCSAALIWRNIWLRSRFRHGFINHLIVGSPSPRRPSFVHFTRRILCAIAMAEAICMIIDNIYILTTFCTLFVGFGHFVSCDCRLFSQATEIFDTQWPLETIKLKVEVDTSSSCGDIRQLDLKLLFRDWGWHLQKVRCG